MDDNTTMPKVSDQSTALPCKHVAILAFPFASHVPPLIAMVTQISASAPPESPAITFSFFSTKTSIAANKFPDGSGRVAMRTWVVDDGLPDGYKPPPHNPIEPVELFLKTVPGNFVKAVREAEKVVGCRISCLVTDAFYWFGSEMAREFGGVPWVPVWTSGPRPLLSHLNTDLIRSTVGSSAQPGWEEKSLDFIPGFELIRTVDLPREMVVPEPNSSNFCCMIDKMGAFLPKAAAVVLNSYHEVDPQMTDQLANHLKTKVLNVGPLILSASSRPLPSPDTHGCLSWLDRQNPNSVVYISFGSVITPPPHELVALAEALEETQIPYLWSFRGSVEEKLPQDFVRRTMDKSRIVPWAPQLEVLRHKSVGAFVTHGGWNSMMESIIGGVPMIVRPFFGDQPLNSRTVEVVWRIGVGIEGGVFSKAATVAAFKRVLFGDEGIQMKERIGVLKNLAYSAVEKQSGSSTKNFKSLSEIIISN